MMPLHGFVYMCVLILILGTIGPLRDFVKNINSLFVYAESVLGATLISVSHCYRLWPIPVYLMLMHLVRKISLWVGKQHNYY
jgi:MFS-type transporter involved in bile tolerance (Atg22 family)